MPNFKIMAETQNIMWIKRLLSETRSKWKITAYSLMGITPFELNCKLSVELLNSVQTKFYQQVLKSWFDLVSTEPREENVLNEILWNNKFILINKQIIKPINNAYSLWHRQGIVRLHNIVNH